MHKTRLLVVTHKRLVQDKHNTRTSGTTPLELNALASRFAEVGVLANVRSVSKTPENLGSLDPRIRIHRIWGRRVDLPYVSVLSLLLAMYKTAAVCRKWEYDLVIGKTPGDEGLGGVIGASLIGVPSIMRMVGNPVYSSYYVIGKIKRCWVKSVGSVAARRATAFAPVSPHLADVYATLTGVGRSNVVRAIPDPAVTAEFFCDEPFPLEARPWTVLFLGRLVKLKNVPTLIKAFRLLQDRNDMCAGNLLLRIVGSGAEKDTLVSMVSELGLQGNVEFTERIPQWEVPNVIAQSHVLVLPSFSEGLPNVLIQAMAVGRPVIASNLDGPRHIVREGVNGFLIEPSDVADLAAKLERLYRDATLARDMGMAGREIARREYARDVVLDKWADLFDEILGQGTKWKSPSS